MVFIYFFNRSIAKPAKNYIKDTPPVTRSPGGSDVEGMSRGTNWLDLGDVCESDSSGQQWLRIGEELQHVSIIIVISIIRGSVLLRGGYFFIYFSGFAIDRSKKYIKTIENHMKIDAVNPQAAADTPPPENTEPLMAT